MKFQDLSSHTIASSMHQLWTPLDANQQKLLEEQLSIHRYRRNEVVYEQGARPHSLYYLLRGKATVCRYRAFGRRQIVQMVSSGGMFGLVSIFKGELQKSTAIADEDTVTAEIPAGVILALIYQNNDFAMSLIREMAEMLDRAVIHTMTVTQKHIRGRLAENLLRLRQHYGVERDEKTLAVYLSRDDLACMSNMTTSNAIRTLSAFAQEGLIAFEGRRIKFLDVEGLNRVSQKG